MMRNNWKKESQMPDGIEAIINQDLIEWDDEAGTTRGRRSGLGGWADPDFDESKEWANRSKEESKSESKAESKEESKRESKSETKSHSRVTAKPAFGFGSSTPKTHEEEGSARKQDYREDRGVELRPHGEMINQRRMSTPARPKEPNSPEFRTPFESEGAMIEQAPSHDEVTIEFNQMILNLEEKDKDERVSKEELLSINKALHARGIDTIHKNTTKASSVLSAIQSKLVEAYQSKASGTMQSKIGELKRSATQKFNTLLDSASKQKKG
jgi:hypothetical protein